MKARPPDPCLGASSGEKALSKLKFWMKKLFVVTVILHAAGAAFVFTLPRLLGLSGIPSAVSDSVRQQIRRDIRVGKTGFSLLGGLTAENVSVSERPDFSAGEFLKVRKLVLKVSLISLLRRRILVDEIRLSGPVAAFRRGASGPWNFHDLALLSASDSGPLAVSWHVKRILLDDVSLRVSDARKNLDLRLENARLRLDHYSSHGGNFSFSSGGDFSGDMGGSASRGSWKLDGGANFEYSRLASSSGGMELRDASRPDARIEKASVKWDLFRLNRPLMERKLRVGLECSNFTVLNGGAGGVENSWRKWLVYPIEILSGVKGKRPPDLREIKLDKVEAGFYFDDGYFAVTPFSVDGPAVNLRASLDMDGPGRKIALEMNSRLGEQTVSLSAEGPLKSPEVKPEMSYVVGCKLSFLFNELEKAVSGYFPERG